VKVDPAELDAFLAGRHVASIATTNLDGSIHLAAMWYLWEDGALWMPTASSTVKARNLAERPHAGAMIDSRGSRPYRGAATSGPVELVSGERARGLNERVMRRYVSDDGADEPGFGGLLLSHDDLTVKITAGTWAWWDMAVLFGPLWNERTVLPLDD
jgi:general stress protein 26